mmetsp:Transcript_2995/g.5228  ORF Transcript_2995/g.5228 Transcript_2995/m.5228 type:complete len:552 (-) Transcript_2995:48-1703(-)
MRSFQAVCLATLLCASLLQQLVAEECPDESYRVSPIVFGCNGGFGETKVRVAPHQSATVDLPLGVEGFRISATSAYPVHLRLHDAVTDLLLVSQDRGLINGSVRAGVYKDVGIIFSGNASRVTGNVSLYLLGALTVPMRLSFVAPATNHSSSVDLAYTFERVLECASLPAGCREYHEESARWQVQVWSRWATSEFPNSTTAWHSMAESQAQDRGVSWFDWPEVWARFVGNSSIVGEEWQPSFRYLDADRDGFVSEAEFDAGFGLQKDKSQVDSVEDMVRETESVVFSNFWLVCVVLVAVLALVGFLCYRRSGRPKRVARSVSKLSREDTPGQALKPRAGAPAIPGAVEPQHDMLKHQSWAAPAAPSEGLWLFPDIGQALPSFLRQESFRYGPLATQEETPQMHAGFLQVAPAQHESVQGWPAPPSSPFLQQMPGGGSFHANPMDFSGLSRLPPLGMPMAPTNEDPRLEAMRQAREAAWAARFAQGTSWGSAPSVSAPSQADAGVIQVELAGPVQVEHPPAGPTGSSAQAERDHWGELAAAVSRPRGLNAAI